MAFTLSSMVFKDGERMPVKYTGDGRDVSPPLAWSGAPSKTQGFALIVDDPDATRGTFTHWVIFNLPAASVRLDEAIPTQGQLSSGVLQGRNDGGSLGYMGPSPPPGKPHHYHFRLYSLDQLLNLKAGASRQQVLEAIKGHILAETEIVGLYQR